MTSRAADNEGVSDGAVTHTWKAPKVSFPVVYYVLSAIMGIVALVLAPSVLTSTQPGHTSGGLLFIFVGVVALAQCLFFLITPAWRVEELEGGHFVFTARRRSLSVAPGALRSVKCIWMDPNRLLPMRLNSTNGSIFIAPRMSDVEGLYKALADANPGADITNPLSIMSRGLIPRG